MIIENDLNPDGGEPELLSGIYSDTSKETFEGFPATIKPLEGLKMFH